MGNIHIHFTTAKRITIGGKILCWHKFVKGNKNIKGHYDIPYSAEPIDIEHIVCSKCDRTQFDIPDDLMYVEVDEYRE